MREGHGRCGLVGCVVNVGGGEGKNGGVTMAVDYGGDRGGDRGGMTEATAKVTKLSFAPPHIYRFTP